MRTKNYLFFGPEAPKDFPGPFQCLVVTSYSDAWSFLPAFQAQIQSNPDEILAAHQEVVLDVETVCSDQILIYDLLSADRSRGGYWNSPCNSVKFRT